MAETRHSRLGGDELHGAKVPMGARDRAPAYVGELLFSDGSLWIGESTQLNGWRVASAPPAQIFSWIAASSYTIDGGVDAQEFNRIALYFVPKPGAQLGQGGPTWDLLSLWEVGVGWSKDSPLQLASWIQQKGKGCYGLVLLGDFENGNDIPVSGQILEIFSSRPGNACILRNPSSESIISPSGIIHNGNVFEVIEPFAEVLIRVRWQNPGS